MTRDRFLELRPDRDLMERMRQIVEEYTDGTLEFDVALILAPGEKLESQLSVRGVAEARLGWTTRLTARSAEFAQPRVVFSLAGF